MPAAVNTGVPLPGGTVNAPGQERQPQNTYFDSQSTSIISHTFSVDESPYYIKAFGLGDASFVQVLMCTNTRVGEIQEPMQINGAIVALIKGNNFLLIDFPGIYRLQILEGDLGNVTVVGGPTALSYWSWGLKAFGAAVPDGGVVIPSP